MNFDEIDDIFIDEAIEIRDILYNDNHREWEKLVRVHDLLKLLHMGFRDESTNKDTE